MQMTAADFLARFPSANVLGGQFAQDLTDTENTMFYLNDAGDVGEARENRGDTTVVYSLLQGETAEMVVSYYTAKKAREKADRPILERIRELVGQLSDDGRASLRAWV